MKQVVTNHPIFTNELWVKEVIAGTTMSSYGDWVTEKVAQKAADDAKAQQAQQAEEAGQRARPISDETKSRIRICLEAGMNACQISKVIDCNLRSIERALREMGRPVTTAEVNIIKLSLTLMSDVTRYQPGSDAVSTAKWQEGVRKARDEVRASGVTPEEMTLLSARLELNDLVIK
ncbi:MAG: hypothetical protein RR740_00465 [Pseudomonas sp.]